MFDLKINPIQKPRYNIAPTQSVAVVLNDGKRELSNARWGLIPSWASDPSIGSKLINARVETIAEKSSFRVPLSKQRCLIWADGFYEWASLQGGKGKQPVYVTLADGLPFAFAGLWEIWRDPEGETITSTTIITTSANEFMSRFHHRMPVILPPEDFNAWLDPAPQPAETLLPLLKQYPSSQMRLRPVSKTVNSPFVDDPCCIAKTQTSLDWLEGINSTTSLNLLKGI